MEFPATSLSSQGTGSALRRQDIRKGTSSSLRLAIIRSWLPLTGIKDTSS